MENSNKEQNNKNYIQVKEATKEEGNTPRTSRSRGLPMSPQYAPTAPADSVMPPVE